MEKENEENRMGKYVENKAEQAGKFKEKESGNFFPACSHDQKD